MRLLHILGTRPNMVKMAPVIAATRERFGAENCVVVHTGQHYDAAMSDVFFDELGMPEPDHLLAVGSGGHGETTAKVLERLEPVLSAERPDMVLVPGDVNSTLAAGLCAAKLGIAVGHVESGLRSFDRTMPEEINRIVTDHLSELLFLHSAEAEENLRAEGLPDTGFRFVGNTMIDTLVALEPRFRERRAARGLGFEPGSYLLVTLHRPALVDGPLLADAIAALEDVSKTMPVVFPVHPRTRKMLGAQRDQLAAAGRSRRLPGLPLARGGRRRRAHGLRRDPGGDDLPRRALLHPARQHRAPGDDPSRDEHAARPRPAADRGDPRDARNSALGSRRDAAALGRSCGAARR